MTWQVGASLETLVYNRDFVEKNFNEPNELKGIFTLGEKNKETFDRIKVAKEELDRIKESIDRLKFSLEVEDNGGKVGKLKQHEDQFTGECWS